MSKVEELVAVGLGSKAGEEHPSVRASLTETNAVWEGLRGKETRKAPKVGGDQRVSYVITSGSYSNGKEKLLECFK